MYRAPLGFHSALFLLLFRVNFLRFELILGVWRRFIQRALLGGPSSLGLVVDAVVLGKNLLASSKLPADAALYTAEVILRFAGKYRCQ